MLFHGLFKQVWLASHSHISQTKLNKNTFLGLILGVCIYIYTHCTVVAFIGFLSKAKFQPRFFGVYFFLAMRVFEIFLTDDCKMASIISLSLGS